MSTDHSQSVPRVLVAHGSPDPRSAPVVRSLARRTDSVASFLEFDQPDPLTVLRDLARTGHQRVRIVPLLLTNAYHARIDIPRIAAEAGEFIGIDQTAPVGDLSHVPALVVGLPEFDGVVVGAAGTRIPAGRSHINSVAQEVQRYSLRPALAAFATGEGPRVDEAVAQLRADGAQRVAVVSYFIAPGKLSDLAAKSALSAGACFVGQPLGSSDDGSASLSSVIGKRFSTPSAIRVGSTTNNTVCNTAKVHTPIVQSV